MLKYLHSDILTFYSTVIKNCSTYHSLLFFDIVLGIFKINFSFQMQWFAVGKLIKSNWVFTLNDKLIYNYFFF